MDEAGDEDHGEEEQQGGAHPDADGHDDGHALAAGVGQAVHQGAVTAQLGDDLHRLSVLGLADVVHGLDGEPVLCRGLEAAHTERGLVDRLLEYDSSLRIEADGGLGVVFDPVALSAASIEARDPSEADRVTAAPGHDHLGWRIRPRGGVEADNLIGHAHGVPRGALVLPIVPGVDVKDMEL